MAPGHRGSGNSRNIAVTLLADRQLGNGREYQRCMPPRLAPMTSCPPSPHVRLLGLLPTAGLTALAFIVMIGGTSMGELMPAVRTVNLLIAAGLLIRYAVRLPFGGDSIDRGILLACVLTAVAGVLSAMPRQSLESVLQAITYAAALFTARDVLADRRVRSAFLTTMVVLSSAMTFLAAMRWFPLVGEWLGLAGATAAPPLNLELSAFPWGHRYDLAFLVVALYPAWWIGSPSLGRRIGGVVAGVVVAAIVVLVGSRALWGAVALATAVALAPSIATAWRHSARRRNLMLGGAAGLVGVLAMSGLGAALVQRGLSATTLEYRTEMWGDLLGMWTAHPLSGYGPGTFPWVLQQTDYFDTNTWAPLHPDSAPIQLVATAGVLGIAALIAVLVTLVPPIWRTGSALLRWVTVVFLVTSIAANPTVFIFAVAPMLAWAAYAAPHAPAAMGLKVSWSGWRRVASVAMAGVVAVAYLSITIGAFAYDAAVVAVAEGRTNDARGALNTAVLLDPGMALYWRQRGVLTYLDGEPPATAVADLRRATGINPSDDLALRSMGLALVASGDEGAAGRAFADALARQRGDPTNLLLSAWWAGTHGHGSEALATLAEAVQSWPWIVAAPSWGTVLPSGITTADVLAEAARRWESGQPTPEFLRDQGLWLSVLAERPDLQAGAIAAAPISPLVAGAELALLQCDNASGLDEASTADRRTSTYWVLRYWRGQLDGAPDGTAMRMARIMMGDLSFPGSFTYSLDPVSENAQFSADLWGYGRLPMLWRSQEPELPAPNAGRSRWFSDPLGASQASTVRIAGCERPT